MVAAARATILKSEQLPPEFSGLSRNEAADAAQLAIEQTRTREFEKQRAEKLEALRIRKIEVEVTGELVAGDTKAANAKKDAIAIDKLALQLKKEYGNLLKPGEERELAEIEIRNNRTLADQTENKKNSQRELNALRREEAEIMRGIQSRITEVTSNPFLTAEQKSAALIPLLLQEAETHRLAGDAALEHAKKNEALALTFSGSLRANILAWVNQFGTIAQQLATTITGVLNTAISGTAQAIRPDLSNEEPRPGVLPGLPIDCSANHPNGHPDARQRHPGAIAAQSGHQRASAS